MGAEFSNQVMSLNKDIRLLPEGAQKTMRWQGLLQNTGSHTVLPSFLFLPQRFLEKCNVPPHCRVVPSARSKAVPGWNSHQMAARLALWPGDWYSEAKAAVSLQLSFCKKKLHNFQSLHCSSLPAVSHRPVLDSSAASGSLRACQKNDFWWTIVNGCAFKIIRLLETFFIHQSVTDSKRMPKTSHPSQTHCVTTKKQNRKSAHGGTRYRKEWTIEMRNVHRLPEVTKGMGSYLSINRGRKAHPSIYWGGKSAVVGGDLPCRSTGCPWLYYFPIAAVGENNGTPLQYSCLENPMDGGAW